MCARGHLFCNMNISRWNPNCMIEIIKLRLDLVSNLAGHINVIVTWIVWPSTIWIICVSVDVCGGWRWKGIFVEIIVLVLSGCMWESLSPQVAQLLKVLKMVEALQGFNYFQSVFQLHRDWKTGRLSSGRSQTQSTTPALSCSPSHHVAENSSLQTQLKNGVA